LKKGVARSDKKGKNKKAEESSDQQDKKQDASKANQDTGYAYRERRGRTDGKTRSQKRKPLILNSPVSL
jgi:hypothetical protein